MRSKFFIPALAVSLLMAGTTDKAHAGLFVSITVAPPALPMYAQPPIPASGYIWTPGYWAWDDDAADYYWVPGAWMAAPRPGLLWTPGYWGWSDGVYAWREGYWGPHVGFYGGVSYGFGYTGVGFAGGCWSGGVFTYNRAVTNVGTSISVANVYNKTVINNNTTNVSFNGGAGGIRAEPTPQERAFSNEPHMGPSSQQLDHHRLASKNPDLKFAKNHGAPAVAATAKAGDFSKGHAFGAAAAGSVVKPASLKMQGAPLGGQHRENNAPNSHAASLEHSDGQKSRAPAPNWVRRPGASSGCPAMHNLAMHRPARPPAAHKKPQR